MPEPDDTVHLALLEDSEPDARLLVRQLRKSGLKFDWTRVVSEQALLEVLDGDVDVVLADHGLPGVNLERVLEASKARRPDTPFLIVSGTIQDEVGVELMKLGADDYLLKDRLERLGAAVERSLERARARRQARAVESRYRNLFERLPVGVYRAMLDGHVIDANPALLLITGFADLEAISQVPVFDMCTHPGDRAALVERLAREGVVSDFETQLTRADGALSWMRCDIRVALDDDGHPAGLDGLLIDIGQRKRAEAEVRRSLAELERIDEAKTNFLAVVSHEFRTALFGIQGYSEMLSAGQCEPEAGRRFARDINQEAQRLGRLISDLLDLARMEAGMERLRLEKVDLSRLIEEGVSRARAGTDRHTFTMSVAPDTPRVMADRDRVAQVLANLLGNAVKYSPSGGEIAVAAGAHPEGVLVEVNDHGMGISPKLIGRVYEPYRRSEAPGSRAIKGTGLGLPIVRHIVGLHGGRTWAESEEGVGSTFRFTLPLRPTQSRPSD
jgi:PAS domain S-box-containing protein